MKERKKRDKLGAEKGRRGCATQKVRGRTSVLEIGPGVSRLITTSGGSDIVTADRVGAYEYRRLDGERKRERSSGRGMERETTLPSNPQSETTRRADETLTEFSNDSRARHGERNGERERETERLCVIGKEERKRVLSEEERETKRE